MVSNARRKLKPMEEPMYDHTSRRRLLQLGASLAVGAPLAPQYQSPLAAQERDIPRPKITRLEPSRPEPLSTDMVREFVRVAHRDRERVVELLKEQPRLVYASWDHGGGDWETGLGAASHVGRHDIVEELLIAGARKNIFTSAMLGEASVIQAMIDADHRMALQSGPHGYRVLYHVAISGEVEIGEAVVAKIPKRKPHLNQALSAAVREGHFDMTKWLLEQGADSVNRRNPIGEGPLETANRRGDHDIADLLRKHGASDVE